jgi:hypothetical protein
MFRASGRRRLARTQGAREAGCVAAIEDAAEPVERFVNASPGDREAGAAGALGG